MQPAAFLGRHLSNSWGPAVIETEAVMEAAGLKDLENFHNYFCGFFFFFNPHGVAFRKESSSSPRRGDLELHLLS